MIINQGDGDPIPMAQPETGKAAREHGRVSDPTMRLQIGGKTYRSVNWSLGGVLIDS